MDETDGLQGTCISVEWMIHHQSIMSTYSAADIKNSWKKNFVVYKKLSYCTGTVRRAMSVNLYYVLRGMGFRKVSNSKVTFKVIQGHLESLKLGTSNVVCWSIQRYTSAWMIDCHGKGCDLFKFREISHNILEMVRGMDAVEF